MARTHTVEQESNDFWAWFGPKVDAWGKAREEQLASLPERDDTRMCLYGEDIVFDDDIVQVPTLEVELAIW